MNSWKISNKETCNKKTLIDFLDESDDVNFTDDTPDIHHAQIEYMDKN